MRHKSNSFKKEIVEFVNEYASEYGKMPSHTVMSKHFGCSRSTVFRYLDEISREEEWGLKVVDGYIETRKFNSANTALSSAGILGSIACGPASSEEEYIEEYVNLPESLFGKGEFYILRATGDSMIDADIYEGDLVVIRKQSTANVGDVIVALDEDMCNTLKCFGGIDKKKGAILEYMNEEKYPDKKIYVSELIIQGVAEQVIHKIGGKHKKIE